MESSVDHADGSPLRNPPRDVATSTSPPHDVPTSTNPPHDGSTLESPLYDGSTLRSLPREICEQIFRYLPLGDRMAFLRSNKKTHWDLLTKNLYKNVTPLRLDRLTTIVLDKLAEYRHDTEALTLHHPDMDEWIGGKGRAGHLKLDVCLDRILNMYAHNKNKLKTLAFTRTTRLDNAAYFQLKRFLTNQDSLNTVVLPLVFQLSPTSNSEILPFGVALEIFGDLEAVGEMNHLNMFLRKGSPADAAKILMDPKQHRVHKAHIFATEYNPDRLWEILCGINGSWQHLKEVLFDSFVTEHLHANPLLRFPKNIMKFTVSNTRPTDDHEDDLESERHFLISLAQLKSAAGNSDLNEFQYQQAITPIKDAFKGITSDILEEFLLTITGLQTLVFHQWTAVDKEMAEFASIHQHTLRSFSWRNGMHESRVRDVKSLVQTCPNLEALGLNAYFNRVPMCAPSIFRRDPNLEAFKKSAESLCGALNGLTRLKTLCLFTDVDPFFRPPTGKENIEWATMGMRVFASTARDNGLLSLRTIHTIHNHRQMPTRDIVSFRITFMPNHESTPGEILVAMINQLTEDEEKTLHSLGGALQISMKGYESTQMKDLYPSEETLFRFWDEESDEYQWEWEEPLEMVEPELKTSEEPLGGVTQKRKTSEELEEEPQKPDKKQRRSRGKNRLGSENPSKG
ncbi:hypothetical protein DM02DRAFT_385201 [Periconia macrospinosa]|uniref:F-box domain-containing protein n=1 Tax=Periconia macrospinosa TaxID=97972 RepID=A0A2V1DV32_9PLEO|nr:hypothetical protein DM02DRAFT_385201 [Periconia macrospinosa]